jgi:hypothetical protein
VGISKITAILSLLNLAANGNSKIDNESLQLLSVHVAKDYPELTIVQLEEIILNGIKGKYNNEQFVPINSITLYRWIENNKPEPVKQHVRTADLFGGRNPNYPN